MPFLYMASPYSSPLDGKPATPSLMNERYEATRRELHFFTSKGYPVYSPIVHCHDMSLCHGMPKDAVFWKRYNHAFLSAASGVIICMLQGWNESAGVKDELEFAVTHWMKVWSHETSQVHIGEDFDRWARDVLSP